MKVELCPYLEEEDKDITVKDYLHLYLKVSNQKIKSILNSKLRQKKISKELCLNVNLINQFMVNPIYNGKKIHYIEDEKFIYFEKPEHVFTQPLNYDESNNVLSFMRSIGLGKYLLKHPQSWEKGFLNRLDVVTSGVLIYVKDYRNHAFIRENFSSIVKNKYYLCIVEGTWTSREETIKKYMGSAGEKSSKVIVKEEGLYAEMDVKLLTAEDNMSFLIVRLKTGIRHQIRSILAHLGHAIVGDTLYGAKEAKRVYLHAYRYQINVGVDEFGGTSKNILLSDSLFSRFLDLYGGFDVIEDQLLTF